VVIPSAAVAAQADREMNHRPDSPRLARRKHKVNGDPNCMHDTDDPGGRQPKHHGKVHVTEDQLDMLWH
jgi:hypothetical protein